MTGNFVTLAAALIHGTAGAFTKIMALPVFCLLVVLTRLAAARLQGGAVPPHWDACARCCLPC